jgi:hypothetical protein
MRARFYEPESGRFVSEDRGRDGWNWFCYAFNNAVNIVDSSRMAGERGVLSALMSAFLAGFLTNIAFSVAGGAITPEIILLSDLNAIVCFAVDWYVMTPLVDRVGILAQRGYSWLIKMIDSIKNLPGGKGGGGKALGAVLLLIAYSGVLAAELFMMDIEAER